MKKQIACLSLLGMMFTSVSAHALEVKGQVSHQYEGGLFSSSPSDDDKVEAIKAAKLAALKQYVSTFNVSKQQQYSKIEADVVKNIDDYISSYTIVAEDVNESLKLLNLVIRADINENKINWSIIDKSEDEKKKSVFENIEKLKNEYETIVKSS